MTTPTKVPAQPTPKVELNTRKFTVEEYYRMAEVGILLPDERVELVNGEIILMPPIGSRHGSGVDRFNHYFPQDSRQRIIVRSQGAIHINQDSEPEPDITLLRFREDLYADSQPRPADILLVMEVSDSTLSFDRGPKLEMYARAGIPETWIMNLPEDRIEVFTEPGPEGYARHAIYRRGDRISPTSAADVEFAVEDLLPPVPVPSEADFQNEEGSGA